jgi:hypothetical protein
MHITIIQLAKIVVLLLMAVMLETVSTPAQSQLQNSSSGAFAADPANFVQRTELLPSIAFPALQSSYVPEDFELNVAAVNSFASRSAQPPLPPSPRRSPSKGGNRLLAKTAIVVGGVAIGLGAASLGYSHGTLCARPNQPQGSCHSFNVAGKILIPAGAVSVIAGIVELRH